VDKSSKLPIPINKRLIPNRRKQTNNRLRPHNDKRLALHHANRKKNKRFKIPPSNRLNLPLESP
jgi:hypothetical protein